jgi:hypothetical protein
MRSIGKGAVEIEEEGAVSAGEGLWMIHFGRASPDGWSGEDS